MSNEKNIKETNAKVEEVKQTDAVKGELTYEDKVIQKIIGLSLENVPGLLAIDGGFFSNLTGKLINTDNVASGVNVEVGKKQVAVDLKVVVEYQRNIPELYKKIKEIVVSEISNMTNLEVVEVNVDVVDIKTKEQHEADSVSLQDRATGVVESTSKFTSDKFESAKDKVKEVTEVLYDQACLIEGFAIKDPIAYSKKICELLVK